ncbi:hypothetical protein PMZ80_008977 [Knufia obscura]|uniref:Uncharacterized protein n=2 Tax=Knufia TaxID=430999 RepID=A0AAN8ESC4_9EURO|nr:hypothetical protein PMZ80_008977 [Knufia obscura]KAK5955065.1 hypothetical protein OHC33_003744 [Knufia fluminis]
MLSSSPPPPPSPVSQTRNIDLETHLDAEIQRVRQQIANLHKQKNQLSSALLGSTRVQKHVHDRKSGKNGNDKLQEKLEEAIAREKVENDTKVYRLAMGVTSFPFTDPAPERRGEAAMVGVRFDLAPARFASGQVATKTDNGDERAEMQQQHPAGPEDGTENTFFVMLRRLQHQGRTYLKVHHHTIPGHIDVDGYAEQYLPLPDALRDGDENMGMDVDNANSTRQGSQSQPFEDDSGIDVTQDIHANTDGNTNSNTISHASSTEPTTTSTATTHNNIHGNNQNLHTFVKTLRDDLQSWRNRVKSINHLRHELNLQDSSHQAASNEGASPCPSSPRLNPISQPEAKYNVQSLTRTTNDARQLQIIWADQTLGILRINYDGTIDRAVVYGTHTRTVTHGDSVVGNETEQPHVRMHEVERLLMVNEDGEEVMVRDLVDRLRVIEERVFSA